MKHLTLLLLITSFSFAQVGIGNTTPNGALDVSSTLTSSVNKAGLVPPIVALVATNLFTTTTGGSNVINPNGGGNPVTGTIVYNTNTSAAGANQVTPGYYFYNGTVWEKITSGATTNWSLTGNAGTTPATNFVGTTDNQDLRLRTNNAERVIVSAAGNVGVGIAPTSKLHIYEATGSTPTATTGTLVLDHGNNGGGSSIVFPSRVNNGSDYGYIRYDDDTSGNGSTTENSLLEIGVQNDLTDTFEDDIAIMPSGNLGVGTRAPKTLLDVNGAISLRENSVVSVITTGVNSNIALGASPASFYKITLPTGAFSLTGLVPATGADGQIVTLENTTSQNFTIVHSATSTATNQILCPGATNLVLYGANSSVTLYYNASQQRWVVIGSVSNANAKPGTVLNTVMTNISGSPATVTVNSTTDTTIADYSYTPVSANSTIIIEFNTKYDIGGNDADSFYSQILVGTTLAASTQRAYNTQKFVNNNGGGTRSGALFPIMGGYTNTSTAAKLITIQARRISSDDNIIFQRDISTWLKIKEIAN